MLFCNVQWWGFFGLLFDTSAIGPPIITKFSQSWWKNPCVLSQIQWLNKREGEQLASLTIYGNMGISSHTIVNKEDISTEVSGSTCMCK